LIRSNEGSGRVGEMKCNDRKLSRRVYNGFEGYKLERGGEREEECMEEGRYYED
jgi:hypothetical protein